MAHVEKRGTGRWRARYRDPNGTERSRTFKRKPDAERFLVEMEAKKLRGEWRDPALGRITYAEWCDRYFEAALHKRPTTMARDRQVNSKHFMPAFGNRALSSLTPIDVRSVVAAMADRLAPATVRTNYGVLRAILTAAVDADMIGASPCRGVKLPSGRAKDIRFLAPDEVRCLADAMPSDYRAMVFLAAIMGLRWSEIAGLRVGRIDFLRRTVEVSETCTEVDGKFVFGDVKTVASRRTLAMPDFVVTELAEHLRRVGRPGTDQLVFRAPAGGPLRRSLFRTRVWDPAVAAAGLGGLTFHHLRHSSVGLLIEVGAHPRVIQARLGHASVRTTMDVYGHVLPVTDDAVTAALEKTFTTQAIRTAVAQ